ncbi:MAG: 1-deoxy-D-xylulose-5-phosphate reductoisomerase [Planctomycetia bacterium]|nr:1-deoxy-D-xylulose-5-phosphate reductoisomerase [Planctomycetia bacterium]
MKNIVVLGSTGSIGRNTLEVVESLGGFRVVAISGHRNRALLEAQAWRVRPRYVILTDTSEASGWRPDLPPGTELWVGKSYLSQAAALPEVDMVVSAIVGRAGLESTVAAVQAGKQIALANKESLVVGGSVVTRLLRQTGAKIVPVDSEHSALFQTLQAGKRHELRRVILTASGGPFREHADDALATVTLHESLRHPTWNMGVKVTLDSATLMNKALEIIEAKWLFELDRGQLEVMIHPQSMVHSMVEFCDGAVIAQISPPDMRLPIQYALSWPERFPEGPANRMDWTQNLHWDFFAPDPNRPRYEALRLGLETAAAGGNAGAVLNAANEVAVQRFIQGKLRFDRIVPFVRDVMETFAFQPEPTLEDLIALDEEIRGIYS